MTPWYTLSLALHSPHGLLLVCMSFVTFSIGLNYLCCVDINTGVLLYTVFFNVGIRYAFHAEISAIATIMSRFCVLCDATKMLITILC